MRSVRESRVDKSLLWASWDVEAEDWTRLRIAVVYDGLFSRCCWSAAEIVDAFAEFASGKPGRVYWAHNGGKYDIKFVLEELLRRYDVKFRVVNGSVVRAIVYRYGRRFFELRDSYPILPDSLARLARSFKTSLKDEGVDRTRIQDYDDKVLYSYCLQDCKSLLEILRAARERFGVNDFKMTIASQSRHDWNGVEQRERGYRVMKELDPFIREAYYGGRVEVFKRYGRGLFYYDVRSMYPYVMRYRAYPIGIYVSVTRRTPGRLGVYRIRVQTPQDARIPLLPYRDGGKLIFPQGCFTGVYCTPEIDEAERLGYRVEVLDGIEWLATAKPFDEYVDKWYGVKQKADMEGDTALRFIAKLHLNSLYGKFGQRRVHRRLTTSLSPGVEDFIPDLGIYQVEEESWLWYTHVHLAAFVASYARVHLHRILMQAAADVYYCDTDSVVTTVPLRTGSDLGDLGLEAEAVEGIFLLPKVYGLRLTPAYADKLRVPFLLHAKGFPGELLHWGLYEEALRGDWSRFRGEKDGVMGLYESVVRKRSILTRRVITRALKGVFTKRVLLSDGIETTPYIL